MSIQARLKNPFVQQYLLEILFPLIGYFFFDWSIVVIVVFYLIDYFASETAFVFRVKRVAREKNKSWVPAVAFATFLSIIFVGLATVYVYFNFSKVDGISIELINAEIIKFAKEELWFLFPLVILMYLFKDQFTFYMPRRYLNYDANKMIVYRTLLNGILVSMIVAGFLIWAFFSCLLIEDRQAMNEVFTIVIFLALKLVFDFTIAKFADAKSKIVN